MPRTLTGQETAVIGRRRRKVAARVRIKDSTGTFVDFSSYLDRDWLRDVDYAEDVDQAVATATVRLWRERFDLSLAPLVQLSKPNQQTGTYAPLIDTQREIRVDTALLPEGAAVSSGDWREVFAGFIDIPRWAGSGDSSVLELECRDLAGPLADIFLEKEGRPSGDEYGVAGGGRPVEECLQDMLDDWADPAGYTIVLYTPNGTALDPRPVADRAGFNVTRFVPAKQPLLEAMRILANHIGWDIRVRWSNVTNEMRLEFFEPDRAKTTPDVTVEPSGYFSASECELDPTAIRNVVRVTYQTDPDDELTRTGYTATDATSIAKYRRRYMEVAEAATSAINSATEAQSMADAMLADLKDPRLAYSVEAPYRYDLVLGDLVRWKANGRHFDVDQDLAVIGLRHRIGGGRARTTVATRGTPAGQYTSWLQVWGRPGWGAWVPTFPGPIPTAPTATPTVGGLILRLPDNLVDRDILHREFHLSTSSGFTPSPATLVGWGNQTRLEVTGLTAGTTYYAKVVTVRRDGVKSVASSEVSSSPARLGSALLEDLAVTTAKLADLAVSTGKLADLAVAAGKLADLAVTTGKLADLAITTAKIAAGAVDETALGPGAVTDAKVAASAGIQGSKMSSAFVLPGTLDVSGGSSKFGQPVAIIPPSGDGIPDAFVLDRETTNYVPNPSFEVDTAHWNLSAGVTALTRVTSTKVWGVACGKVDVDASGFTRGVYTDEIPATNSQEYAASVYLAADVNTRTLQIRVQELNAGAVVRETTQQVVIGTTWKRVWVNALTRPSAGGPVDAVRVYITTATLSVAHSFYVDGVQLERLNEAVSISSGQGPSSYCDGDRGPGFSWSGTAHASTSTRSSGLHPTGKFLAEDTGFRAQRMASPAIWGDDGVFYGSRIPSFKVWKSASLSNISGASFTNIPWEVTAWRHGGVEFVPGSSVELWGLEPGIWLVRFSLELGTVVANTYCEGYLQSSPDGGATWPGQGGERKPLGNNNADSYGTHPFGPFLVKIDRPTDRIRCQVRAGTGTTDIGTGESESYWFGVRIGGV